MVKVSVVVPAWKSPQDGLERLMRSLDSQTMPASDFEVIFVDDGSPDDTVDRLKQIASTHSNVRVESIEASGWPSKPRNVGVDIAHGEYVLFMDHDDELYPRALEAGYTLAKSTGADVVTGKETRTDQSAWGLDTWTHNMNNSVDRTDVHPLIPTNPHKLFRRSMLTENSIKFPEGGRVLWEDVFFNADVAAHSKVIAVLADTPFYHWVRGATTTSSSFTQDPAEWWQWVRRICDYISEALKDNELQRKLLLMHQYRSRVLAPLARAFQGDALDTARDVIHHIQNDLIPQEWDAELACPMRIRAALLRENQWDLLPDLIKMDSGYAGISTAHAIEWNAGILDVHATTQWSHLKSKQPLEFISETDRLLFPVTDAVARALPRQVFDVTDEVFKATTTVAVRSRDSKVSWLIPTEQNVRLEKSLMGRVEVIVDAVGHLDPSSAASGQPLDVAVWDVCARNIIFQRINQRNMRFTQSGKVALADGHVYIAYRNDHGMLSLDIDQGKRSLSGSAPINLEKTQIKGSSFSAPLKNLKSFEDRLIPKQLVLRPVQDSANATQAIINLDAAVDSDIPKAKQDTAGTDIPVENAAIETSLNGAANFVATIEAPEGKYEIFDVLEDREVPLKVIVTVSPEGQIALLPNIPPEEKKSGAPSSSKPSLMNRFASALKGKGLTGKN